ncbi:MAG: amidohydrolase family protein [Myxococcota bacterium]
MTRLRSTIFLGLCAAALSLPSCDIFKSEPPAKKLDEAASEPEKQAQDDEPAEDNGPEWKANDVHAHLNIDAYPLVIDVMDDEGIYRTVNLSGSSSAEKREEHLEAAAKHDNRIAIFFNLAWSKVEEDDFGEQMAAALEDAVQDGYAGLKISKALGLGVKDADGELLPVDSPKLDPVWEKAGELGIPVSIHTSDPKAFFEKPDENNERWMELKRAPSWSFYGEQYPSREELLEARDRVVAKHRDTNFILVHFANNPEDVEYVASLLEEHPNVYVDVSARIGEIGRHPSEKVREIFEKHADRILFGTDFMLYAKTDPSGTRYRLTLGSVSKDGEQPELADIASFYEDHWRYFETDEDAIEHPVPIQGDWKVHPIDLGDTTLQKLYIDNSERLIFAPWLGRNAANHVIHRAKSQ